jgi:anhydro-N-acetylmuramic acid kinase
VNVGGIANITILSRDSHRHRLRYRARQPLARRLDRPASGLGIRCRRAWAGTGTCDATLLQQLLEEPYLNLPPPKSTGRELFNLPWLNAKLGLFARRPEDVQATLQNSRPSPLPTRCGNTRPARLCTCAAAARTTPTGCHRCPRMAPNRVASTAVLGLDPDYVEAVAFAWFAAHPRRPHLQRRKRDRARGARILGGIYRYA